ncbi:uncharacterized protein LOC122073915 isoform X2 [Macadamia integrifolia]|uniref:uncharacterized protein LOC122073915 isoform X2 n=1 Tax=Macadamia integrifolia TaxID=60698 RepID=UPI001C501CE3|nr:uncharacterized protein LOC122073915 isoform X2 [Macadamia integrifolia]
MESKYSAEMMTYLEKQRKVLMDAYWSMSHELHRLHVEESMLMQKFNEVMSAQAWLKRVTVEKMLQTIVRVKNLEIQFASQAIKRSIGVNLSELLSHEYLGMLF